MTEKNIKTTDKAKNIPTLGWIFRFVKCVMVGEEGEDGNRG